MGTTSSAPVTLRDLPLPVRLVLSAFLLSVGLGYFSALVQLHFQHASAGEPLPEAKEVVGVYHGQEGLSELERLVTADESRPFASGGSMKPAFFGKSAGWKDQIKKKAKKEKIGLPEAEKLLRRERDVELAALVGWVRDGARRETYEAHPVAEELVKAGLGDREPREEFFKKDDKGQWTAVVANIVNDRCVRCHQEGKSAGQIDLSDWERVSSYCEPARGSGLSVTKLAQSTHVHLLGFSMLYGLTGVIFAFTSLPRLARCLLAPLPLLAQVADVACWWLARVDPVYAKAIIYTGGVVASGLAAHIVLSLFNMYRTPGKVLVLLLLVFGGLGVWQVKERVIDPYLAAEKAALTTAR